LDYSTYKAKYYGLSIILGSYYVNLLDLTNAYRMLINKGVYQTLVSTKGMKQNQTKVFSAEASWMTLDILKKNKNGLTKMPEYSKLGYPEIAWKSGTSFGHKDAIAIGLTKNYSIGIWVGNFDAKAVYGLSGSEHAAPLLYDLARIIEKSKRLFTAKEIQSLKLKSITLCESSRQKYDGMCERTMQSKAISGVTLLNDNISHRTIFIDKKTGLRLNNSCLHQYDVTTKVVKQYPMELISWWKSRNIPFQELPKLSDDCQPVRYDVTTPMIVSPNPKTAYVITSDLPYDFQKIPLRANAAHSSSELVWLYNGEIIARTKPGETYYLQMTKGEHQLMVIDQHGSSDKIVYTVH
jgi:penicillin-binding protein 1C